MSTTNATPSSIHYVTADPLMSATGFDALLGDWERALGDFAGFIGFGEERPGVVAVSCGPGTDAI